MTCDGKCEVKIIVGHVLDTDAVTVLHPIHPIMPCPEGPPPNTEASVLGTRPAAPPLVSVARDLHGLLQSAVILSLIRGVGLLAPLKFETLPCTDFYSSKR